VIGALEAQAGRLLYDTAARVRPGGWLDRLAFGSLRLLSWLPLSSKRAKRVLGRLYALRGDAGEAERWLASALGAGGSLDGVTRYHLGVAQLAGGRVDAAVANLRAAVGAHPGRDWYHLKLAEALQARGLHGEAEEHIREALRLKPSSALAHFRLFMALRPRLGDGAAVDAWLDAVL